MKNMLTPISSVVCSNCPVCGSEMRVMSPGDYDLESIALYTKKGGMECELRCNNNEECGMVFDSVLVKVLNHVVCVTR